MINKLDNYCQQSEVFMQRIDTIVSQLKSIMDSSGISQNFIISALDGKCSRNTILSFFKGDSDCKLTTLLMVLEACNTQLRFDTEMSKEAILSGDISEYRAIADNLRDELTKTAESLNFYQTRYQELIDKNTSLTNTIEKQQELINRYIVRMENAENALYSANADIRRKDAKIVDLMKKYGQW